MTTFEKRFLSCRPDPGASAPSPLDGLALSPGPLEAPEPLFSYDAPGIEEYSQAKFLETLASLDGVTCLRSGGDSPWAYRWTCGERSIEVVQSPDGVFELGDEVTWLGSRLRVNCTFADLVRFWNALRARHPGIWLFNRLCRMFSPQSFLEECALPALCAALASADPSDRARAGKVFGDYAALAGRTRRHNPQWREMARHMAESVFALRWPVVPLHSSAPWRRVIARKLVELDRALDGAGVRYYAHPAATGESRCGLTVWVPTARAAATRTILRRLGLCDQPAGRPADEALLRAPAPAVARDSANGRAQ
jgi:hypothetical protein